MKAYKFVIVINQCYLCNIENILFKKCPDVLVYTDACILTVPIFWILQHYKIGIFVKTLIGIGLLVSPYNSQVTCKFK